MPNEPVCIRRVSTDEEAEIIVAWLDEHGIDARITDPSNPGVMAFGVTDAEGIAIYVSDQDSAKKAEQLLAEHDKLRAQSSASTRGAASVEVTCEECGRANVYPAGACGTVQECSGCSTNLDVPAGPG